MKNLTYYKTCNLLQTSLVNPLKLCNRFSRRKLSSYLILTFLCSFTIGQTYGRAILNPDLEVKEHDRGVYAVYKLPLIEKLDIKETQFMSNFALNVYDSKINWEQFRKRMFLNDLEAKGYEVADFNGIFGGILFQKTEGAGFIAFKGNEVIICYHGTASAADWLTDLDFAPTSATYLGISSGTVHRGFLRTFKSTWESTKDKIGIKDYILAYAKRTDQKPEDLTYHVTGHSLGGALATLTTSMLINDKDIKAKSEQIKLLTFAAPRVFSKTASLEFEKKIPEDNYTRYVIKKDIVPKFFKGVYRHTKKQVILTGKEAG